MFAAEICWLVCEGHQGPLLNPQQRQPRNKALHLHLSKRRPGSPTSTKLSPELIGRQLKVVWECDLQMDSATEAYIPLWGEKKKQENKGYKQIVIIINHVSVYSTVIILFVGSLWGFIPPWKHRSYLHDVQHGLLSLTCKLIIPDFSSAFSLLGRQRDTASTRQPGIPWLSLLSGWASFNVVSKRTIETRRLGKSW